jgi:hypothetical protein
LSAGIDIDLTNAAGGEMENVWWIPLLTGGLAFVGAMTGNVIVEKYKCYRDKRSIASALAGEICAIIDIADRRQHVRFYESILVILAQGNDVSLPHLIVDPHKLDPIAEKHLDKIGLLGSELPEKIAKFYTYLSGIRHDIHALAQGASMAIHRRRRKLFERIWRFGPKRRLWGKN